MAAAVAFALLLVAFVGISWLTRNARRGPRCCRPGAWPPDDITARTAPGQPPR